MHRNSSSRKPLAGNALAGESAAVSTIGNKRSAPSSGIGIPGKDIFRLRSHRWHPGLLVFEAQYPARRAPCQRFDRSVTGYTRMTRGHGGLRLLRWEARSSSTLYQFCCHTIGSVLSCSLCTSYASAPEWSTSWVLPSVVASSIRIPSSIDRRCVRLTSAWPHGSWNACRSVPMMRR